MQPLLQTKRKMCQKLSEKCDKTDNHDSSLIKIKSKLAGLTTQDRKAAYQID